MSKQAIPELIPPTTQSGQALATGTKYTASIVLKDGVDALQRRLHVRRIGEDVEEIASVEEEADVRG